MTRIRTAAALLIIITVLCICSPYLIKNRTVKVSAITENIVSALEKGDNIKAAEYADEALDFWNSSGYILDPLVRSDRLMSVYTSLVRLRPLIESDSDEIYAEIKSINAQLEFISEIEFPYICNIF